MNKNILEELNKRRISAKLLAEGNLKKAKENKDFLSVYTQIKQMELDGIQDEKYKTKVLELSKILNQMGMTFDNLMPKYECSICHDTGFVDGKMCQCLRKLKSESLLTALGGTLDRTHTFKNSNFDIFDDKEKVKKIYAKIEEWSSILDESQYKNLLLSGPTGSGKTYLSECIANKLIDNGVEVGFYSAFALSSIFLKFHTTFGSEEEKYDVLDEVLNAPVLFIDDLGSEPKYNNVTEEYMYVLITQRLKNHLPTIFTTNLLPEDIASRYGERTFSRICNKLTTLTVLLDGNDVRLKKRK